VSTILYETKGSIARITINRPEAMNALNNEVVDGIAAAIDAFEADELARETFGPEFHASFVELKRGEWEAYSTVISQWERDQYLHLW
jgi:glutamine synthetase